VKLNWSRSRILISNDDDAAQSTEVQALENNNRKKTLCAIL
jgi:hypothetical protein